MIIIIIVIIKLTTNNTKKNNIIHFDAQLARLGGRASLFMCCA